MKSAVFLLSVIWLPGHLLAQELRLPCEARQIAVAGDGSGVWFVCPAHPALEKTSKTTHHAMPGTTSQTQTEAYWLPTATNVPVNIESVDASLEVLAASSGSRAVIVRMPGSGPWKAVLYDKRLRLKELPIDPSFLLWSADSQKLYFYGGSTIAADTWDILGAYDIKSGAITRTKLQEPTEILQVCRADGKVYSVTPEYPNHAGSTIEYTSALQFVKKIQGWVGALFSAQCKYVASEYSLHGPLPWRIYEVSTGKSLYHFSALDEEEKDDVYEPVGWNPKYESLLLRRYFPQSDGPRMLEVFDVGSGGTLQSLPDVSAVAWSADGTHIITADGNRLVWHPANMAGSAP